ncbi:mucin-2-like [Ictalurus furcatus]|nr:mucin-2-like [Ictalurus furcatus]
MVCPVACPLTVSCSPSAMVVNLGVSTAALRLKVNGVWQPVYQASTCGFTLEVVGGGLTLTAPYASNCWQFEGAKMLLSVQYMDRELTLSCPAVQPPATTPLPAHMYVPHVHMGYPFPYGSCITWHFHSRDPGASTDAPMTTLATTVAPASAGQLPLYPWLSGMYYPSGYGMPWNFPYGHPGTPPVTQTTTTTPATTSTPAAATTSTPAAATTSTPAAATTSTPAATVALASAGQLPLYPWLSGMYYPSGYGMPWNFPYSQPGTPPVTQTTTTTPATTSTPAAATTSTPAATGAPASAGQLLFYPDHYNYSGYYIYSSCCYYIYSGGCCYYIYSSCHSCTS